MPNQFSEPNKYPYEGKNHSARELLKIAHPDLSLQTLQTRLFRWKNNKSQCTIHEIITLSPPDFTRLCIERRKRRGYLHHKTKEFIPTKNDFDRLFK